MIFLANCSVSGFIEDHRWRRRRCAGGEAARCRIREATPADRSRHARPSRTIWPEAPALSVTPRRACDSATSEYRRVAWRGDGHPLRRPAASEGNVEPALTSRGRDTEESAAG